MEIRNIYGDILLSLKDANLKGANLKGANLEGANLEYANLEDANLKGANLKGANLEGANLEYANLEDANLEGANLEGANLEDANLEDANLKGANLKGANLKDANLKGANLEDAVNFPLPQLYILKQLSPKTKITLWKYIKDGKSPISNNPITYIVGKSYVETIYESDERVECGAGLSLATLQWCLNDSLFENNVSYIECQFTPADIVAIPFATDGKIRVKKLKVLREVGREEAENILKKSMKGGN